MTGGRARVALLSLLLLAAQTWQQMLEQGEEDQRQGDRPLSYREWPSERCDFSCQSRQFRWRQERVEGEPW